METCARVSRSGGRAPVLDLPIRDGNFSFSMNAWILAFVLDLPIRDGNPPQPHKAYPVCGVLDLPIRDGNNLWLLKKRKKRGGFRPSYKGWKHGTPATVKPLSHSFRPSYKGWKLLKSDGLYAAGYSFRPSYKGWKLPTTSEPKLMVGEVLDLPIRDGNCKWGNLSKGKWSFRPSYKGWKPVSLCICSPRRVSFRPSYKGWKLKALVGIGASITGFRPSYKGWKQANTGKRSRAKFGVLDLPIRDGNMRRVKA